MSKPVRCGQPLCPDSCAALCARIESAYEAGRADRALEIGAIADRIGVTRAYVARRAQLGIKSDIALGEILASCGWDGGKS